MSDRVAEEKEKEIAAQQTEEQQKSDETKQKQEEQQKRLQIVTLAYDPVEDAFKMQSNENVKSAGQIENMLRHAQKQIDLATQDNMQKKLVESVMVSLIAQGKVKK